MLIILLVTDVIELILYTPVVWKIRKLVASLLLAALAVLGGAWFPQHINGWSYVALAVMLYRCVNLLRITEGVGSPHYLRRSGAQTSLSLMTLYTIAQLGWFTAEHEHFSGYVEWLLLALFQFVSATVALLVTNRNLEHMRPAAETRGMADRDVPSITVAIPARNETVALQDCLNSLLASDYPKLEILVLDDESHDRTPEVIKSFAHHGVRFVKGKTPPQGWLAKNWAYEQLYQEANGLLIVYCGVDIRFTKNTLRRLVTTFVLRHKRMVCVMPTNVFPTSSPLSALLLQPIRYVWEVSLPRRLFKRPPVLSSCWVVERALIHEVGSFAAVRSSVSPESHFARRAVAMDGYSFVRSLDNFEVTAAKSFAEQSETAVRTRYPQLHRRPELLFLLCLLETMGVVASFPMAIAGFATGHYLLGLLSTVSFLFYSYAFRKVVRATYGFAPWQAWFAMIPAVLADAYLRNYSMYRYEFDEVLWKGRNVGQPMMEVIPHLPTIET